MMWLFGILASCSNEQGINGTAPEQNPKPVIEKMVPASAYRGDTIKIVGKNFSTNIAEMEVSFTGAIAQIISATPTEITVTVPLHASSANGMLFVTVREQQAMSPTAFELLSPGFSIYSMHPTSGSPGQELLIKGDKLPADTSQIKVTFNGHPGKVTAASIYDFRVVVPHGVKSEYFTININGKWIASPGIFKVIEGGKWEEYAQYPENLGGIIGFAIDGKIYSGLGLREYYGKFYQYDPSGNTFTRLNNFPGSTRSEAFSFVYNGKGYIACGTMGYNSFASDVWSYEPSTDTWTRLNDFPGEARYDGVSFVIGSKAYVGLGKTFGSFADFWEYDFASDTWTKLADFPGGARHGAGAFTINGKGYVFGGMANDPLKDLWEFDPANNTWTQKQTPDIEPRIDMVSFAAAGKGYISGGWDYNGYLFPRDTWAYDPQANSWTRKANFYAPDIVEAFSVTIDDIAFIFARDITTFYRFQPNL